MGGMRAGDATAALTQRPDRAARAPSLAAGAPPPPLRRPGAGILAKVRRRGQPTQVTDCVQTRREPSQSSSPRRPEALAPRVKTEIDQERPPAIASGEHYWRLWP
jgi:hypothetical protein